MDKHVCVIIIILYCRATYSKTVIVISVKITILGRMKWADHSNPYVYS